MLYTVAARTGAVGARRGRGEGAVSSLVAGGVLQATTSTGAPGRQLNPTAPVTRDGSGSCVPRHPLINAISDSSLSLTALHSRRELVTAGQDW